MNTLAVTNIINDVYDWGRSELSQDFYSGPAEAVLLAQHREPETPSAQFVGGRVIVLNEDGDVLVGFDNAYNPIFKSAADLDGIRHDAILTNPGYTEFVSKLSKETMKAFDGATFVEISTAVDPTFIDAEVILKSNPTPLGFVIEPESQSTTVRRMSARNVVFFNGGDLRISKPLERFKQAAYAMPGMSEAMGFSMVRDIMRAARRTPRN